MKICVARLLSTAVEFQASGRSKSRPGTLGELLEWKRPDRGPFRPQSGSGGSGLYRATARTAGRIASPEILPSVDPLPHLKCSRPGFGGVRHEADQHGNT